MISVQDAQRMIRDEITVLEADLAELESAAGRVLREDIRADTDLPSFDRSAVDGYAVAGDGDAFDLIGSVQAGEDSDTILKPGQALRIFTGAQVPHGADRVVMQEDTEASAGRVTIVRKSSGWNIRRRGEDALKDEVLVPAGTLLRALDLSVLATVGAMEFKAARKPRVAHLVSGNEIVAPDHSPRGTQIRDSNGILIRTLVDGAGGHMIFQDRVRDDYTETITAMERAEESQFDLLLFSGGASVGDYDFCKGALKDRGYRIHFDQVNVRPGKPLIFATRGTQVAFGIPGNPVSHLVTFRLFIASALAAMAGSRESGLIETAGKVAVDFTCKPNERETWWPARQEVQANGLFFHPLEWKSSGHHSALVGADVLLKIPSGAEGFREGEVVEGVRIN